ncbi:MAG: site-specific DNA-methyltransferase [Kiritimatiellae bacterium]|nr:site-specific DNA-methyltransferase [Kiritimatiellia bacterium]
MIKDAMAENAETTPNSRELAVLKEHFPGYFRKDGSFDVARFSDEVLRANGASPSQEGFGLDFLGKNYAKLIASLETETVIVPDEAHNSLPENQTSRNVYITGDNLDALKHLLKSYSGQVKCIYIDPPYNTGSDDFVYNDTFKFSADEIERKLGIDEEQARKLMSFTSKGSSSHSAWLTFMYPRLQLAKGLLSNDGVIFISIDDNEVAQLRMLCDSVFGEENFVAQIVLLSNPKGRSQDKYFATNHEYIMVYSRNELDKGALSIEKDEVQIAEEYPREDDGGRFRLLELRNTHREFGKFNRKNLYYPLYVNTENGSVSVEKSDGCLTVYPDWDDGFEGCWTWQKSKAEEDVEFLVAEKNGSGKFKIYRKSYASGAERMLKTILNANRYHTEKGQKAFNELFGEKEKIFQFPKSPELLKDLLKCATSKYSLVLDFFSGSGTTADALMRLNEEDSGTRQFIMVQIPKGCREGSPAAKAGYKTIDEIGRERIKRAAKKIREENPLFAGDLGFKHYTLKPVPQDTLDKLEVFDPDALVEDASILDAFGKNTVLETWLVKDGYGFAADVQAVKLKGYTAYWCGRHLYLIEPGFTQDDVAELFKRYDTEGAFSPDHVVLFGYSFAAWSVREMLEINLRQLKDGAKNLQVNIDTRY